MAVKIIFFCISLTFYNASAVAFEPCKDSIKSESQLKFDDQIHRLWYRHFWKGDCSGLPFWTFCSKGQSWEKAALELESEYSGDRPVELRQELCQLGQRVGYEWARDNSKRCIDTNDLRKFRSILKSDDDVFSRLDIIQRHVDKKMNGC